MSLDRPTRSIRLLQTSEDRLRDEPLSSAEVSLYCGEAGEKEKESARGHDGKGEERREAPAASLFPSSPARFLFFVDY